MKRIYLDANGSTPAIAEAKDKLLAALELFGNPSSSHDHGRILRAMIDEARHHVACAIGAKDKDVVFTSGASEANRLFVDALILRTNSLGKPLRVLMSPFEHPSLMKPVMKAHEDGFFELKILELDSEGRFDLTFFDTKKFDVIIACSAHNETGIIPSTADLFRQAREDALLMSDISQGFARIEPPSDRIDVLTFSGQKMGAFPGVGGAIFRSLGKALPAPWLGGGQERGYRPGTESFLLIVALGEAAKHALRERKLYEDVGFLRDYFENKIASKVYGKIIGQSLPRLPNTSAITFQNKDPDALRISCDLAGLSVGFGSACSGLAPEGSFALKKLGLTLEEEKATIRFSLSPMNSQAEIDDAIERLVRMVLV